MIQRCLTLLLLLAAVSLFAGCAAAPQRPDYSAFKQSQPRSIVVLPPLNESPDVKATYGVLSQVTYPLAEAGYYVLPVALVAETFKQNGLDNPGDIHQVPAAKLSEIFGADTALYIVVKDYGTRYKVLDSVVTVAASATLVDLKTGATLWTGSASASSQEGGNNGGGLLGQLVAAALKQIINSVQKDAAYPIAGIASQRLLSAGGPASILYGPRSPKFGSDY
ncbi:MAG: DUF799 domain-containing protein [Desulfovibrionaceae bacterium]|jgi:hypothetical protein|nr:DUF799 domain-containing protein [Desulfovibrionaceae bacterium]